jgi:hypothetical protein
MYSPVQATGGQEKNKSRKKATIEPANKPGGKRKVRGCALCNPFTTSGARSLLPWPSSAQASGAASEDGGEVEEVNSPVLSIQVPPRAGAERVSECFSREGCTCCAGRVVRVVFLRRAGGRGRAILTPQPSESALDVSGCKSLHGCGWGARAITTAPHPRQ